MGLLRLFARLPLCLAVFVTACSKPGEDSGRQALPSAAVQAVVRKDLLRSIRIASEFKPYQEVDVHAKVAGYVKTISVDIGDFVHAGQVFAVLEVPELEQDVQRTRAARLRAQAEIREARSQIERYRAIAGQADITYRRLAAVNEKTPNLVPQQDVDIAHAKANSTAADLSARRAALAAAEQELAESQAAERRALTFTDYARIAAPFDGVVTRRYADTGAMVAQALSSEQQAMPVVRIAQVDPLRLSFPVPEAEIAAVRVGGMVDVQVPAIARSMSARIWRFSGKADQATRTMETQVLMENRDRELKPGMIASVELTVDRRPQALAIPIEAAAIGNDPHHTTVMRVGPDDRLEECAVELGIQTATDYEVLSGLADGDRVIVAGRSRFRAGQRVDPKPVSFSDDAAGPGAAAR